MRKIVLLALAPLLAVAGCSPPGPARIVEPRLKEQPARGLSLLRQAMLDGHNRARAAVGVAPLVWDNTLADHALTYARTLAAEHRFEHAAQPMGPGREGENLWTGTRGAYRYDEMVGGFVDEKRYFRNAVTPDFSTTGRWEDVAHYTQIIWRGTTRFGCALASNERDDYLVCRYTPPGNVVGQLTY